MSADSGTSVRDSDPDTEGHDRDPFEIGSRVIDSEADESGIARVINLPRDENGRIQCDEWTAFFLKGSEITVADDNPSYPADSPVVVCLFEDQLESARPNWDGSSPLSLSDLEKEGLTHFAFPPGRLSPVPPAKTPDTDPEANDECADEANDEPPETLQELAGVLGDSAEVALESNNGSHQLKISKLGVVYTVSEDGIVDGDGPHHDAIESKVNEVL